jgi:endonuclease/exonuclease/phosphatase family metal-dependent hydrolase
MTYNILKGAGADTVDPGNKEQAAQHGFPGNRLPTVLEVIRTADPDILGIQEAHQWNMGSPPVVEKVADELGMDHFLGLSTNSESGYASVVLFTKFDIKEAESYTSHFSRGAVRAELVTPAGNSIHVFVVHLDGTSHDIREAESTFLVGEMQAYVDDFAMLIGDMNFLDRPTGIGAVLRQAGWSHPLGSSQYIDQIWTSSVIQPYVQSGPDIPSELTSRASDHRPVVVEIGVP